MATANKRISNTGKYHRQFHGTKEYITPKTLSYIGLFFISLSAAGTMLILPDKFRPALLALPPAAISFLLILLNPFIGVFLYYFYEFLRPYDIIPSLIPLRLAIAIEATTLASWIIHLIKSKSGIKWESFIFVYAALCGIVAITVCTAMNNFLAYNIFQMMIVNLIFFLIVTNTVDSPSRLYKLIWLLILIHLYFALKGIFNFHSGRFIYEDRQTSGIVGSSFVGDENDFALAINVMIPFAYYLIFYAKTRFQSISAAMIIVIYIYAIVCSFSRGGLVGLCALSFYIILNSRRKFFLLIGAILIGIIFISVTPSNYLERIETISHVHEGTAQARINYWKAGMKMYLDHPIIGVGAGNGGIWMPYYISGPGDPNTEWGRTFHGSIPQIMAELGTLGSACYIIMIYLAFKKLRKIKKEASRGNIGNICGFMANSLMGGIIAFLVTGTFLSVAYYPQIWLLFTLTMTLSLIAHPSESLSKRDYCR